MTMLFIIFLESIVFYNFLKHSKATINTLLIQNVQSDILHLEHYMQKNIQQKALNEIVAHIDNFIALNPVIDDIDIFDNDNNLIYDPDARNSISHQMTTQCLPVAQIANANLFKPSCYTFVTKTYNGLDPIYMHTYLYINNNYAQGLLHKEIQKYIVMFLIATVLFSLLLWSLFRYYVIHPLETLRRYAYYNDEQPPENFFIQEIESIRYSLAITFERLNKEQKKLYNLSTKDPLSGLHNRLSLIEKLNWLISRSKREKSNFAIIYLDLDNFKNINDSKGHEFGDKVLLYISEVLLNITRQNDIISRIGGDEFVIVLPEYEDENKIIEVAQRLKDILSKPFQIAHEEYEITASMGIAIYPKDGENVKSLLKNADIAMYKSKELGKNNYQFFTEEINQVVQERIKMQKIIKDALQNNHFKLYYQPKVAIATNEIVGCEALIRLIDPEQGIIPPDKFISIAEESNLVLQIGEWVIKEAVSQIKQWENTPLKNMKVSINISGVQFKDNELLHKFDTFTHNIDRAKLDVELTESVFIENFDTRLDIIKSIKAMGISLSLDDFGTGYSSLAYLKNIPFDTLKIDKSFIDKIETKDDLTFVNMIIGIADDLKLDVVAEGVETQEQLALLKELRCEQYQGYLCSKPVCAEEFEELFNKN